MALSTILLYLAAILGVGFLVFIHEMGHYLVARYVGMRVDAFSIGFGPSIVEWERDGCKWKICWIFLGGYVQIGGVEEENGVQPHEIPDGFFGKSPWARIQVAVAGPLVNLIFAYAAFFALWSLGGQVKSFAEVSHVVGFMDPASDAYKQGLRPGARIVSVEGAKEFGQGYTVLIGKANEKAKVTVENHGVTESYTVSSQALVNMRDGKPQDGFVTIGVLGPANYLIVGEQELPKDEPAFLADKPFRAGDRIIWANGELIYSRQQFSELLNTKTALLRVLRKGELISIRAPLVGGSDIYSAESQALFKDYLRIEGLAVDFSSQRFLPWALDEKGVVGKTVSLSADSSKEAAAWAALPSFASAVSRKALLEEGDQIQSINFKSVGSRGDILKQLQRSDLLLVTVKTDASQGKANSGEQEDALFTASFDPQALEKWIEGGMMENTVFTAHRMVTKVARDIPSVNKDYQDRISRLKKAGDSAAAQAQLTYLEASLDRHVLGLALTDRSVRYNPPPHELLWNLTAGMANTIKMLFTGQVGPSNLAGPVGIISMVSGQFAEGINRGIYWLGFISLNFAFLNMLPIPVLDGGKIVLFAFEMITRRRITPKTIERLTIPFVFLLLGLFIYITFWDIWRLTMA